MSYTAHAAPDIRLIFPPQWSPFQPFLSTPSLKAHLERKGYDVIRDDWNLGFYHHFISRERLSNASARLTRYASQLGDDHADYRNDAVYALSTLNRYDSLLKDAYDVRDVQNREDIVRCQRGVYAFYELTSAFSTAEPAVVVSPSSLQISAAVNTFEELEQFTSDPVCNPFIDYFQGCVAQMVEAPRYFGISIIGTEQILAGLTLGRILKDRFPNVPVIIGGSVFSRLVEKDSVPLERLFGRYFDLICRYEGETPLEILLAEDTPLEQVPNMAYLRDGHVVMNDLCNPLDMKDIPTPDFGDLPLDSYLSPGLVLPILATRGCYWGKCAFCYHGMIYQDRYRLRPMELINEDIETLFARHGTRHFAFNDEALPPKLFRHFPDVVTHNKFFFTALYKFERFFSNNDYERMYGVGFRSFYIGLETASERVQRHMKKNNRQETMIKNLQGAHDAGIWNHTFNFFGFPTETEEEADETANFLLEHADIIHSEGTGTFSFEHNAPISHDPLAFGVTNIREQQDSFLTMYYDYEVESGIDAAGADRKLEEFREKRNAQNVFKYGRWIPREYLLLLLSEHGRKSLLDKLAEVERSASARRQPLGEVLVPIVVTVPDGSKRHFLVNRLSRHIFETSAEALQEVRLMDPSALVEPLDIVGAQDAGQETDLAAAIF